MLHIWMLPMHVQPVVHLKNGACTRCAEQTAWCNLHKEENSNPQLNALRRKALYQQKDKQTFEHREVKNHIKHLAPATSAYIATMLNKNENQNNAALTANITHQGRHGGWVLRQLHFNIYVYLFNCVIYYNYDINLDCVSSHTHTISRTHAHTYTFIPRFAEQKLSHKCQMNK